jgi:hypothetical protein
MADKVQEAHNYERLFFCKTVSLAQSLNYNQLPGYAVMEL